MYMPAERPLQRWHHSSLFPASRFGARIYRLSLRLMATAGIAKTQAVRSGHWPLQDFIGDLLPGIATVVVLIGTPSPSQGITVQVCEAEGRALGYVKYAEKNLALRMLRQEQQMLCELPSNIGPELMRSGPLGNGQAILKSALPGKQLAPTLPPPKEIVRLLESLEVAPPMPPELHPWVRRMREHGEPMVQALLEHLMAREWPVVMQHGDFAPWNLIRNSQGTLRAVDWECGTTEGFPYVDMAYYILQTAALVYRWSPRKAAQYAERHLFEQTDLALSRMEAGALTRLAAYDAYMKSLANGVSPAHGLQAWRRNVWSSDTPAVRDAGLNLRRFRNFKSFTYHYGR